MFASLRGSLRAVLAKPLSGLLHEGETSGDAARAGDGKEGLRTAYHVSETELEQEDLVSLVRLAEGTSAEGAQADGTTPSGRDKDGDDWEVVEEAAAAAAPSEEGEAVTAEEFLVVERARAAPKPTDLDSAGSGEATTETPRRDTSDDDANATQGSPTPPAESADINEEDEEAESSKGGDAGEASAEATTPEEPRDDAASEGGSTTTEEEPSFRCVCRVPVFKAGEVISSNYHAQTSPGYLLSALKNVQIAPECTTAVYTTGRYTIQEVACEKCSAVLGVTYSGAADVRNQYKVGKFLVGCDRLLLPPGTVHPMMEKNA